MKRLEINIRGAIDIVDIQTVFYTNLASFPVTGLENLVYVAKDTLVCYLWDGTNYVVVGSQTFILQNGNSFGVDTVIGTSDNFNLLFKTNNITRGRITNTGDVELFGSLKLRGVSNFVTLRADSSTSPYTLDFPATEGVETEVLTKGTGSKLIWTNPNANDIPEWIAPPTFTKVGSVYNGTGLQGQKAFDNDYIYLCVADNEWRATPIIL